MTIFQRSLIQDQIDDARMAANSMTGSEANRTQIIIALAQFEQVLAMVPNEGHPEPVIVTDDDGEA